MNKPLPVVDSQTPVVCRLLRTKTSYSNYASGDRPSWKAGQSTTAVYWCLATMNFAGPDNRHAHPSACTPGRTCFKPEET